MCGVNLHTEEFMTKWTCVKCSTWSALRNFTTRLLNIGQIPLHTETLSHGHLKEMRFCRLDFSTMSGSCSERKIVSATTWEKMLSFGTDLRFDGFQKNLRDSVSAPPSMTRVPSFFTDTEEYKGSRASRQVQAEVKNAKKDPNSHRLRKENQIQNRGECEGTRAERNEPSQRSFVPNGLRFAGVRPKPRKRRTMQARSGEMTLSASPHKHKHKNCCDAFVGSFQLVRRYFPKSVSK